MSQALNLKRSLGLLAVVVCIVLSASMALADEYSATQVTTSYSDGKRQWQAITKIYVKGNKIRRDTIQVLKGKPVLPPSTTIYRGDKNVNWTLLAQGTICLEHPMKQASFARIRERESWINTIQSARNASNSVKRVGQEKVNGFLCDRYEITGDGRFHTSKTLWVSKQVPLAIRSTLNEQTGTHRRVLLRHDITSFKRGKVADSLFEIPRGCKKAN
jgi:hypothetical protein